MSSNRLTEEEIWSAYDRIATRAAHRSRTIDFSTEKAKLIIHVGTRPGSPDILDRIWTIGMKIKVPSGCTIGYCLYLPPISADKPIDKAAQKALPALFAGFHRFVRRHKELLRKGDTDIFPNTARAIRRAVKLSQGAEEATVA